MDKRASTDHSALPMDKDMTERQKVILSDPITEYSRLHPACCEHEIEILRELHRQYRRLKNQRKETRLLSRKISRHIGELKRQGQSTEKEKHDVHVGLD
ncbi:MAG: hypothetical protein ACWGOW_00025, partial [Gammaproteobacteria bacterium]